MSSTDAVRDDAAAAVQRARIASRVEIGICLIVIAYIVVLALNLSELSRDAAFFPKILIVAAAILAAMKLASLLSVRARRLFEPELFVKAQAEALPETEVDPDTLGEDKGIPAWAAWAWLLATILAMTLFGIVLGSGVACFAYIYLSDRRALVPALVTAAITAVFLHLVFVEAMRIELGYGVLDGLLP